MSTTTRRLKRLMSLPALISLIGWLPWLWARIGDVLRIRTILQIFGVDVTPALNKAIALTMNHGWIFGIVWLGLLIVWPDIKQKVFKLRERHYAQSSHLDLELGPATYRDWEHLANNFNDLTGKSVRAR